MRIHVVFEDCLCIKVEITCAAGIKLQFIFNNFFIFLIVWFEIFCLCVINGKYVSVRRGSRQDHCEFRLEMIMAGIRGYFVDGDTEGMEDFHQIIRLNTSRSRVNKLSQHLQLCVGDVRDDDAGILFLVPEYALQEGGDAGEDEAVAPYAALSPEEERVQEVTGPPAALHPVQDGGCVAHLASVHSLKSEIQK